ncbi:MAG: hypothetical protein LBC02_06580 [Planctomycetaceae bacterium]|nr:hypothetical protein [Planctomycetaceae bacterium]
MNFVKAQLKQKYFDIVLQTLFISATILFGSGATLSVQDIDRIVQVNEETKNSVQSLKIVFTLESILRFSPDKEQQTAVQCVWYWDNSKERLKQIFPTYLIDQFFDGKNFYFQKLSIEKVPLSLCYQGDASGYYHVQNESSFHHESPEVFCNVFFPGKSYLFSLKDLIKNWTIISSEKLDEGDGLVKICAEYPPNGSIPELRGNTVQIIINTKKSCSIQNVLCFDKNIAKDKNTKEFVTTVIQLFVSEYHHEDNIFFPKKGKILFFGPVESFEKNEPFHEIDYTATNIDVNKYEMDTGFAFSPNLIVFENKSKSKSDIIRIHLWGENNKPVKTFQDLNQLQKYIENTCDPSRSRSKSDHFFVYRVIMGFTGFLLILLVVYLKTRKRRQ